jgi:hypothetical protein
MLYHFGNQSHLSQIAKSEMKQRFISNIQGRLTRQARIHPLPPERARRNMLGLDVNNQRDRDGSQKFYSLNGHLYRHGGAFVELLSNELVFAGLKSRQDA